MKKILASVLAIVLAGSMAVSSFAAVIYNNVPEGEVISPKATLVFDDVQGTEYDVVITPDEEDLEDNTVAPKEEEITVAAGDTITVTGLPADEPTKLVFATEEGKGTVLVDKTTGKPVPSYVEDGKLVAVVTGDSQLEVVDNATDFSDLPGEEWADDAITAVTALGLMVGYEDGLFHPERTLTAAQVFTSLSRLAGADLVTTGENWDAAPMAWAAALGLTDGLEADTTVTRQQLIDILAKFAGVEGNANEWVVEAGLFVGDGTGNLMADDNLTRAQFAAVLYRYIKNIVIG